MSLLLGVMGIALLMTSCLGEGRNYTETSVAYIAMDETSYMTFGRTLTGRIIISSEIQMMQPGSFKFFTYSWDEENGTTAIGESYADNVKISGDPVDLSTTMLKMTEAPAVEEPFSFVGIDPPYFANDQFYLGDHWLFQYAYEAKQGEHAAVDFYLRDDETTSDNEVDIDIHLTLTGAPEDGASTRTQTEIIALNMAPLRTMYQGTSQTSTKEIKLTFRYYLKGYQQPVESQTYTFLVAGD